MFEDLGEIRRTKLRGASLLRDYLTFRWEVGSRNEANFLDMKVNDVMLDIQHSYMDWMKINIGSRILNHVPDQKSRQTSET